jgi:thiamine kinase-like enzyme
MVFVLDSANIFDYLERLSWGTRERFAGTTGDRSTTMVRLISAKNFNLLVQSPGAVSLLVKQETIGVDGQQAGELFTEWKLQQLIPQIPELQSIASFMPEILHCDPENSIVINRFLEQYQDLADYYNHQQLIFSPDIAGLLGNRLGLVHQLSFDRSDYQQEIEAAIGQRKLIAHRIAQRLSRLSPGLFSVMPIECLQFFKLYQQYPSLAAAMQQLATDSVACCLVHNDLKLNNVLISPAASDAKIRLIDWERASWGDPAGDLGMLIASYLELWLESVVVSNELSITESLQLATVPLELIQPSLLALLVSYLDTFPEIIVSQPHYLQRVLQYTGLLLIYRIEAIMESDRYFGNQGIIMLQVAKQLLCSPTDFMNTVFGKNVQELLK